MDCRNSFKRSCILLPALVILMSSFTPTRCTSDQRFFSSNETNDETNIGVQLMVQPNQVVMYNGIARVTLTKPGGLVIAIQYNGIDNLLENADTERHNSGYWDCDWGSATGGGHFDKFLGTEFKIISNTPNQVEISFVRNSYKGSPLNVDKRFIMLRGSSGFYTYSIYEHLKGWPWVKIDTLRIVFKLNENIFKYMAISDKRQKVMPTGAQRAKGTPLAYKEAVRLQNGEVDDKYQYASDNKDSHLHGWIADNPATGFWMITPSDEFRVGGPFRQDLTSHTARTTLSMFVSSHYALGAHGESGMLIKDGEPWKKVFGPVFVHLNKDTTKDLDHRQVLWKNAKRQMYNEIRTWPYNFPLSADYLKANQRGSLRGQLQVLDRYRNKYPQPAAFANVGLALPGAPGSCIATSLICLCDSNFLCLSQGYQFWTKADKQGSFMINGVRPGIYNLYAWVCHAPDSEEPELYWDCDWGSATGGGHFDKFLGTEFKIISNTPNQVEISFVRNSYKGSPLNVDKRFIMLRGSSGFYTYSIYEHLKGWPWVKIDTLRIVFKLNENIFKYMAISDKRQKVMPTGAQRAKGTPLAYKEAVRLQNGEVDDKYQYASDNKDSHLHGWIADNPATGFWMITPSDEFRVGGPFRQDLTSHTARTTLSMFVSSHYALGAHGESGMLIKDGEPWKKVFGPVFVHLNKDTTKDLDHRQVLWKNAKRQMYNEIRTWPYNFPLSADYLKANQRGSLRGQLQVLDRYRNKYPQPAAFANVGLALPGAPGSWETENKGYQFWTKADKQGSFMINGVRPGIYNLYAWVPGVIGDYMYNNSVKINQGGVTKLNGLVFEPPRSGPTLWEIGYPDRLAAEFYVPDVNPYFVNHLYTNFDKFRQYGLWERYSELYPKDNITFTVGSSNYKRDWFYAHVPRIAKGGKLLYTTWNIVFQLKTLEANKDYTLRFAFAGANYGKLHITVNNGPSLFTIGPLGKDNAIARHGIHGIYHLADIKIRNTKFVLGKNIIHLTMASDISPFAGFLYDYIRFEGPSN